MAIFGGMTLDTIRSGLSKFGAIRPLGGDAMTKTAFWPIVKIENFCGSCTLCPIVTKLDTDDLENAPYTGHRVIRRQSRRTGSELKSQKRFDVLRPYLVG